jgi:glycosyltransferase involved in cell wall biosynthesis
VSKKKKILYISLRSDFGGATLHIDQLIQSFNNNYEIYCAAPVEKPYGLKWLEKLGDEKLLELPHRSFSAKHLIRLIFFIKRNKIEIIHAHGKGAGIYARLAKIFIPKTYLIYTFHGLHIANYTKSMKHFYIFLEKVLGKLTNQFINVSNGEKQVCLDNKLFKASKSTVIYNAIENDENHYPDKDELRRELNLQSGGFIILSVIRFNPQKNIPAMLEIANKLSDDKNFMFILIGDGEEKSTIEKNIIENNIGNVKLLGYQKNVNKYLHASDLFLSTSLWEGLPYSLIEATRAGIPIVASDVIGNNEVVFDNQNGYLYQVDDNDSAAYMLKRLRDSNKTLETFGQNSKKVFKEYFVLNRMINKLKKVYFESEMVKPRANN